MLYFIKEANYLHEFYVMAPGKLVTLVIIGQSWQRKYNCKVDWRQDGIIFQKEETILFKKNLGDE